MWGIDLTGHINLKAINGYKFILVAVDFFTKWVEANSYAHVTEKMVKHFLENDLIYWYGSTGKIVTNNA